MSYPIWRSCVHRLRYLTAARSASRGHLATYATVTRKQIWNAHSCAASMPLSNQARPESKPVLLIVDDDHLITDTLTFALAPDFEVHACDSRPNAVDLVRQLSHAPQL